MPQQPPSQSLERVPKPGGAVARTGCGAGEGPLQLGPVVLGNRVLLAPMAGITDRPFRTLCRRLGAGLTVSEMLSASPALRATRKSSERADLAGEPGPIAAQIAGSDPQTMADAARFGVDQGAQIIDINLGCPARKVCRADAGSALLRDEALVARILTAVTGAVRAPVTLKTRTGWSPQTRNLARIARIAEDSGIAMLTVHGRTRACGYGGHAEHDSLRAIRPTTAMPLVANGDIRSPEQALAVLRFTGADAVMIGRAARGRPWIFREIAHYLATGQRLPRPPADWVRDTLLEHLDALYRFYGEKRGVRIARKHIRWYCQVIDARIRNGTTTRRDGHSTWHLGDRVLGAIMGAETASEQTIRTRACFDGRMPREDAA
jgi:tRNA-dihydrouridine synthase B